jgi:hypothetical protein
MKKKEKVMKQKKFKVRGTTLFVYKSKKPMSQGTTDPTTNTESTMACAIL